MYDMMIIVDKAALLAKLEENRDKHRAVFEDALLGYRNYAESVLHKHIQDLADGKIPEIRISISRPEDHTRDYDRVIGMLRMHRGDEFDLDEQTYAQYVDDDWSWKRQWLKMSSSYAPESVTKNYGVLDDLS